jgi:hypothetical protein
LDVFDERSASYNNTSTFVSADKGEFSCQWPITVHCVEICVTDTGVFDVDENLIWAWLLNWNFLVDNSWAESVNNFIGTAKMRIGRMGTHVLRSSQRPGPIALLVHLLPL